MSNISKYKNGWLLWLFILIGIVLGGLIAELTASVHALSWLSYGQSFGLDNPLVLNLGVLVITFALQIKITIASIIGVILAIVNPQTISNLIGENSGFVGVLLSSIIGSITMMPTFVAFSTGQTLLQNGAGYPQVGALIATLTMVGIITYPLESKYIGKKGALLRNLLAFFFSFIVALLIEKVVNLL